MKKKSLIHKLLRDSHQSVSHSHRIRSIAGLISQELIDGNKTFDEPFKVLDIGCGDMKISSIIDEKLSGIQWNCIDIYSPDPNQFSEIDRQKYKRFDGRKIPFDDNTFEVALFIDVLHHCDNKDELLSEAKRVAKKVVIKEHFEYGPISRSVLRAMDFYGNWAYGVSIPKRYFDQRSFAELCDRVGLKVTKLEVGIDLYGHLPLLRSMLDPQWQFLAKLEA